MLGSNISVLLLMRPRCMREKQKNIFLISFFERCGAFALRSHTYYYEMHVIITYIVRLCIKVFSISWVHIGHFGIVRWQEHAGNHVRIAGEEEDRGKHEINLSFTHCCCRCSAIWSMKAKHSTNCTRCTNEWNASVNLLMRPSTFLFLHTRPLMVTWMSLKFVPILQFLRSFWWKSS